MKTPETPATGRDLLKMDSGEATERMRVMPLEQQRDLVLSLEPGRKREDLILLSDRPEALTHLLPLEDFVLTIHEIGGQDTLALLELSSDEQANYLLDLDLWVGADLDMQQVDHWLTLFMECGTQRTLRLIDALDFELVVLTIERWCLLVERDAVQDLPDALADRVISPDNFHFLLVKIGADLGLVRQLVDLLFHEDQERLLAITGNLGTTPLAELEELSLRWRNARLADRGWPDLDEAMAFYQPLSADRIPARAALPSGPVNPSRFGLDQLGAGRLFQAGLTGVTEPLLRERLAIQIANLCNRVIVADRLSTGALDSFERAGQTVSGRLEIGLAELGAADSQAAARLLAATPLLHLAQLAQAAILKRRTRAVELLAAGPKKLVELLQAPLPERLRLLAGRRPVFLESDASLARPFASRADLALLDHDLDLAEAGLRLARALELTPGSLPDPFPPGSHPPEAAGLSLQMLLLTAFARHLLDIPGPTGPLPAERLADLHEALAGGPDALPIRLSAWATCLAPVAPPGLGLLLDQLSGLLRQGFLPHRPDEVDLRYVDCLWTVE